MKKYKFPTFTTVFENPTIIIDGHVGTKIINNVPTTNTYCDILIETPQTTKSKYRLEGSPEPEDWTMASLGLWVSKELKKYEV